MEHNNDKPLTLDGDTFAEMKKDFAAVLAETVKNMREKNSNEATLTLKLNISLNSYAAMNENTNYIVPSFEHNISSVMSIKNKVKGSLRGDFILVKNKDGQYAIKDYNGGQMSIYD